MELTKESSGLKNFSKKLQSLFNEQFKAQKTYIVPTRLGMGYGGLCLILLLMAMAYGNNLVFVVCFTLTVMGMTLARAINTTIDSLDIQQVNVDQIFAEKSQNIQLTVQNRTAHELLEIKAYFKGQDNHFAQFSVGPHELLTVDIPFDLAKRGWNKLPRLIVESKYPSGLFRAWKVHKESKEALVFPARRGNRDFPSNSQNQENSLGLVREIRDYQPGDSPKRIHWRSYAKTQQLRTLVYEGEEGKKCHFGWSDVSHLNLEEALSQLSLWLFEAEKANYNWTLELPKKKYESEHNPRKFSEAMEVLALWRTDP